jgi:alpha-L-fucosidase 2
MEWREDWNADNWSGQLAALWGLWPGDEITPQATPDLTAAARKTMMQRDMMFGSWCSAVRLNYAARMADGALAEDMLNRHMRGHLMPNLLSKFSDRWGFQVVGNLGVAAGIGEVLLQSHERNAEGRSMKDEKPSVPEFILQPYAFILSFLPALPPSWKDGRVTGLHAHSGFEVDMAWKDGKLSHATIRSVAGTKCKVRYVGKTIDLDLPPGTSKELKL